MKKQWPEFSTSMQYSLDYQTPENILNWKKLEKNYTNFKNRDFTSQKIPKIIHQIWIGKPMKSFERECTEQVKNSLGDDWSYKLWTNDNVKELNFIDRKLVNELGSTRGGIAKQADLIRCAALYEFGGIYMDTDFLLHRDFNELLDLDFFIGIAYDKEPNIFNGLIGSIPKSKLIKDMTILDRPIDGDPLDVTGPWFATRKLFEHIEDENIVAFPNSFFYPYPNFHRSKSLGTDYKSYIKEETICTHLWSSAWM